MIDFPEEFDEPSELPALGSKASELYEKEHASDPDPSIPSEGGTSSFGNSVTSSRIKVKTRKDIPVYNLASHIVVQ